MNKIITITFTTVLALLSTVTNAASHSKSIYINQYDTNNDGNVHLAEFDNARQNNFNNTDENKDGAVSENEYIFEYQDRMDKQLTLDRLVQVKQTTVRFKALDKNENAKMEWQEYQASGVRSFTKYDVNKDGTINDLDPEPKRKTEKKTVEKTELQLAQEKQNKLNRAKRLLRMPTTHDRKGFFIKYDLNQDNIITQEEFNQRRRQDFDRADEDANNWLTEQEYIFEYENRLDKKIASTRKAALKQTHIRFNVLDKDEDGAMTFAEYQLSGHRSFTRWDTDKDGIVNNLDPAPKKNEYVSNNKTAKSSNTNY
ncbi:EF-hand domain-containing protein [Pseudoalteromonas fuliginea]|uniref:EF-hand domain-containing protein n=2 Tax=Pseudoalteromonas TaxID=53246 RepID=A0A833AFF6_9GAMM|nr:hypothetical protein [Pseudoalteromonas fuliginea]KAA1152152.1 hypothetical protein EU509_15260 [Pseudoalteromonas fuliginea]KAA1159828.1 hypothetical protein EU508_11910 [Pseudoalteromonas fuliginea]KAA1166249.1 hypothetical protein EUZ79_15250 [Pseudoalteromonas fuliginea]